MATIEAQTGDRPESDPLVERARRAGFELASRETDTGQVVWEWRHGDGPRPQFVTERVACHWMAESIEHFEASSIE